MNKEDMEYEINRLSDCVIQLNERLADLEGKIEDHNRWIEALEAKPPTHIHYPHNHLFPPVF